MVHFQCYADLTNTFAQTQITPKINQHIEIQGSRKVTWSKDPQILGATVQNLVARATWQPELPPTQWQVCRARNAPKFPSGQLANAYSSQKCRSLVRILSAIRVTRNKFHTEDLQILGATVQNSVARATWRLGCVQPCICMLPLPEHTFPMLTTPYTRNITSPYGSTIV
jgi:hypothetical protein